jgi:microcystin degradation protein MlrC
MRVGLLQLWHRSNTFVGQQTLLSDFTILRQFDGSLLAESSAEIERLGAEAVPIFFAAAPAGGVVAADASAALIAWTLRELAGQPPLDGLLAIVSGSAVSETALDLDGAWMSSVRAAVGNDVPIVGLIGASGNLSPALLPATDALVALPPDQPKRKPLALAAKLLVRAMRREVKLTQAAAFPAVVISSDKQHPDDPICQGLLACLDAELQAPRVLAGSVLFGNPYVDVPHLGPGVVFVTDDALLQAQQSARHLADFVVAQREAFQSDALSVSDAVQRAMQNDGGLTLLDLGDSLPDGSTGDGTVLLAALIEGKVASTLVHLVDPTIVEQCRSARVGDSHNLLIGGQSDWRLGEPIATRATIQAVGNLPNRESGISPGMPSSDGPFCVLRLPGNQTVLVTAHRCSPWNLDLRSIGLHADAFSVLVAKQSSSAGSGQRKAPRATVAVNTPGPTTVDLGELPYHRRRRPMFPFEEI